MQFVTYALIFLWLPASLAALVFFIRPSRRWPIFGTRLRSFLMLISLFFGIPLLGLLVAPASMKVKPGEEHTSPPVAASTPAPTPAPATTTPDDAATDSKRYLELSGVQTARSDHGAVLVSGKIFNGGEQAARNPRLKCYLSKDSQDAGAFSGVVRKTIPAGQEVAFASLNMGAAKGAWNHEVCEISSAQAGRP